MDQPGLLVIGVGLPRTGTWSTAHALSQLLDCPIEKIHHGMQLTKQSHSDLDFWINVLSAKNPVSHEEWRHFFKGRVSNFVEIFQRINSHVWSLITDWLSLFFMTKLKSCLTCITLHIWWPKVSIVQGLLGDIHKTKLETLILKAIQLVWTYQPYCSIKSYWLFFLTQELYWRYEILGHGTCHGIIPLPKLWSWLKVHLTNGLSSRIKR